MSPVAPPEVRVLSSADAAVPVVFDEIRRVVGSPKPLVSLATGDTYAKAWNVLQEEIRSGRMANDFVLTHLGEYMGFGPDRPGGIVHELASGCPLIAEMLEAGTFLSVPSEPDARAIVDHEARIMRSGGISLQFLGLGRNGHIAFNEPGASFERGFHVTALASTTRADLRAQFASAEPPRQAVTSGVGNILGAKRLVLCAFGRAKAVAVREMLNGPIGSNCPASAVRRHPNALVLLDPAAAAEIDQDAGQRSEGRQSRAGDGTESELGQSSAGES